MCGTCFQVAFCALKPGFDTEGYGAAGARGGDVAHRVEVVAVGEVTHAEVDDEPVADAVADVGIPDGGGAPVVGLAGGFEQVTHALLDELVVLFAVAATVVDAAYAELEFFAEEAYTQV